MNIRCLILSLLVLATTQAQPNFDPATYPGQDRTWAFHDAAGTSDTTAIWKADPTIVAWASGHVNLQYGTHVGAQWQTPEKAYGPAVGDSFDVVVLGRGGQITMTFPRPIRNGSGFDFAVFENGFSPGAIELAWVEVSTDGLHFVRFPNFSYTPAPIGGYSTLQTTNVHGFASKYRQGFGTPFDLSQLQLAFDAASADSDDFHADFKQQLLSNFPYLNLEQINYVRIIDIVGAGAALSCEGLPIYDPYPTSGSAGFDLEAVAVLHQVEPSGQSQSIDFTPFGNQILGDASISLEAVASSGLPVDFEVISGPGLIHGSVLHFTGLGQVVVRATQAGDANYAPADPVTRSGFIADALQHLYLEPIANQLTGASQMPLHVRSSSGLPVSLFVDAGPEDAVVDEQAHRFTSGSVPGRVTVRASQTGGQLNGITYAPAEPVFAVFDIVAAGDAAAPQSFAQWQLAHGISGSGGTDTDADGVVDFVEYVGNSNPQHAADRPDHHFEAVPGGYIFELRLNGRAPVRVQLWESNDLSLSSNWSEIIPEVLSLSSSAPGEVPARFIRLRLPQQGLQKFWRFQFEAY